MAPPDEAPPRSSPVGEPDAPRPADGVGSALGELTHLPDALATIALLGVLGVAALVLAWPAPADEGHCRAAFDRWATLRMQQAEPRIAAGDLERRREAARERAQREGAYERCLREADARALACTERAQSIDELERCFP
jgi:hypothetical protein